MNRLNRRSIYESFANLLAHGMERREAWRLAVSAGKTRYRMGFTNEQPC